MGCGLDGQGIGVQFLDGQETVLFSTVSRPALRAILPPFERVPGDLSLGVVKLIHSSPSSAEAKNIRAVPPLPIHLHDMELI
jgi:hypothetical protein